MREWKVSKLTLPRNPQPEKLTTTQKMVQAGCLLNIFLFLVAFLVTLSAGTIWFVNLVINNL